MSTFYRNLCERQGYMPNIPTPSIPFTPKRSSYKLYPDSYINLLNYYYCYYISSPHRSNVAKHFTYDTVVHLVLIKDMVTEKYIALA